VFLVELEMYFSAGFFFMRRAYKIPERHKFFWPLMLKRMRKFMCCAYEHKFSKVLCARLSTNMRNLLWLYTNLPDNWTSLSTNPSDLWSVHESGRFVVTVYKYGIFMGRTVHKSGIFMHCPRICQIYGQDCPQICQILGQLVHKSESWKAHIKKF